MTTWTVHLRADEEPILLRDGFSWAALLFGPIWLLTHRAWVPAALSLAAFILLPLTLPNHATGIAIPGLMLLHGLSGRDLLTWSLEMRGYPLRSVIVAASEDQALARLLDSDPRMAGRFMPAGTAR